jgi:preprotein translocase subunit SecG
MNDQILGIAQLIISILLIGAVLLQQRGTGLSSTFGGLTEVYSTRRGLEKSIFIATIILSILLVLSVIFDLAR